MFARLCAVVGLPELAADPRFATNTERVSHADELAAALEGVLRAEPAAHWLTRLREAKVPAGPINEIDEAFALAEELGMEPTETVDGVPLVRPPLRIDGERPPIRQRPPRLGEHDADLRAWLSAI
jgi:crotonobetainyl-CoA:carnitine CoA-transferase CaiB-like acyl-CoA transferase